MIGLLVLGVVAVFLLYAADRLIKARAQTRRLRVMSKRLAAAAARAERQQAKREAVAAASAELTSVLPAINHPVLTPAKEQNGGEQPGTSQD